MELSTHAPKNSTQDGKMTTPAAFKLENLTPTAGYKLFRITFDLPGEKVNKFSANVITEFEKLIDELEKKGKAGEIEALIFRSGKTGNFIAGADINMIQATKTAEEAYTLSRKGHKLIDRWEDLPFPTIVAINGTAMGGGCELSLGSTAIVMSTDPSARIGLPEVNIGVIPGMGGCIRLPRKVGIATALDLILTGKTLPGDRAAKAGLAEACLAKEDFDGSVIAWVKLNLTKLASGERIAKEPKLGGMGGLMGSLLEKNPIEAPPAMVERNVDAMLRGMLEGFERRGLDVSQLGVNIESLRDNLRDRAQTEVKAYLVLDAIGEKEKLEVSDDDLEKHYVKLATEAGQTPDKIKQLFKRPDSLASLKSRMKQDKAYDLILAKANLS